MTPFTGFLPDVDPTTLGVITDCTNLAPSLNGYRTAPGRLTLGYAALASACQGAVLCMLLDGTYRFFAATGTKLYEGTGGSWTDRTRAAGGNYTLASDLFWSFCQFGNTTIATNMADALQQSASGAFASIATSPTARLCETIAGFVMLADTNDGTAGTAYGDQADRWWCSSYMDATSGTAWTPSVTTQCTTGRLTDIPGPIRALKRLGSNIVAYKDKGLFIGAYVGAPSVFAWQSIPGDFGSGSQQSVISVGSAHYFIGYENIYMFDGSRPRPIGDGIKKWFFTDLHKSYRYRIAGVHDRLEDRIWFFYPNNASSAGELNAAIVYNYTTGQWGRADQNIEVPVEILTGAVTYTGFGTTFSTYDAIPTVAYDSPLLSATAPVLSIFDTAHAPYSMTAIGTGSSLVTGDYGDDDTYSTLTKVRLRFVTLPTSASATNFTKQVSGEAGQLGATSVMEDGKFDFLSSARWHRVRFDFVGDMTTDALWIDLKPDGTN